MTENKITCEDQKKLDEFYAKALEYVASYNELATKIDHEQRLGLASNSYYKDDDDERTYDEIASDCYETGGSIDSPGTVAYWFPSSIC